MVIVNTPLTKERVFAQPYDTEIVHESNTTVPVKDQQDQIRLNTNQALRQGQGQHTNALSYGWVDGIRSWNLTVRGNRKATYGQVQRAETIRLR